MPENPMCGRRVGFDGLSWEYLVQRMMRPIIAVFFCFIASPVCVLAESCSETDAPRHFSANGHRALLIMPHVNSAPQGRCEIAPVVRPGDLVGEHEHRGRDIQFKVPCRRCRLYQLPLDSFCLNQNTAISNSATSANQVSNPRPWATPTKQSPMAMRQKFHYYLKSTYGPLSMASSLAGSGIRHGLDYVPEWGQGMEGYGKRLAASFGEKAVKNSIQFGAGALLHEDPRYFASNRSGIWRRTLYAAGQTFISHKDSGGIMPAYSRFVGIVGGVYISRQWYPEPERTAEKHVSASATSLGLGIARNVFSEFWPDIKRMFFH
jgi:hypothetical protein